MAQYRLSAQTKLLRARVNSVPVSDVIIWEYRLLSAHKIQLGKNVLYRVKTMCKRTWQTCLLAKQKLKQLPAKQAQMVGGAMVGQNLYH